jgi:hypothetical protein
VLIKEHTLIEKNLGGRPTIYKEEYPELLIKHFNQPSTVMKKVEKLSAGVVKKLNVEHSNKLPTVASFCRSLLISGDTFYRWVKEYPKFSDAYRICKKIQEDILVENSMNGKYNPTFVNFWCKNNIGWTDQPQLTDEGDLVFE